MFTVLYLPLTYRFPSWGSSSLLTGSGHVMMLGCAPGIFSRWLSTPLREVLPVSFGLLSCPARSEASDARPSPSCPQVGVGARKRVRFTVLTALPQPPRLHGRHRHAGTEWRCCSTPFLRALLPSCAAASSSPGPWGGGGAAADGRRRVGWGGWSVAGVRRRGLRSGAYGPGRSREPLGPLLAPGPVDLERVCEAPLRCRGSREAWAPFESCLRLLSPGGREICNLRAGSARGSIERRKWGSCGWLASR